MPLAVGTDENNDQAWASQSFPNSRFAAVRGSFLSSSNAFPAVSEDREETVGSRPRVELFELAARSADGMESDGPMCISEDSASPQRQHVEDLGYSGGSEADKPERKPRLQPLANKVDSAGARGDLATDDERHRHHFGSAMTDVSAREAVVEAKECLAEPGVEGSASAVERTGRSSERQAWSAFPALPDVATGPAACRCGSVDSGASALSDVSEGSGPAAALRRRRPRAVTSDKPNAADRGSDCTSSAAPGRHRRTSVLLGPHWSRAEPGGGGSGTASTLSSSSTSSS